MSSEIVPELPAADDVLRSDAGDNQKRRRSLLKRRASRLVDSPPEEKKEDETSNVVIFIIQLVSSFILAMILAFTLKKKEAKGLKFVHLAVWKWELMALVLILGRLVSRWGVRFTLGCMKRKYMPSGLKGSVANCVWWLIVTTAWFFVVGTAPYEVRHHSYALVYGGRLLLCLLVGNMVWLMKRLLIEVVTSSFHVKTYFDPIQESLLKQHLIGKLSGTPIEGGSGGGGRLLSKHGVTFKQLQMWNSNNVSAWNMKKLIDVVMRVGLSTLDEPITSETQATAAAERIFGNVAKPESEFIYLEDILCFLSEEEADALKTMDLLFEDEGGSRISTHALKDWVVHAFKERRAIACSLNDTNTAVNTVHLMLNVAVGTLVLIVSLLIIHVAVVNLLLALSSQFVLGAFYFGDSAKRAFEGIVFLFLVHPFDVGDHVEIDGIEMVVEKMDILTTVFVKCSNGHKIYYSNNVLATKSVELLQ